MLYWNRNLITSTEREPSTSESSGIFDLVAQHVYKNDQKWPIPGIVESGLKLYLDAGDSSSYSGTGTTWTDLSSSGNNGTLTNGPTYSSSDGGYIYFDGSNDYVDVSGSITASTATFLAWIYRDGNQGNYDGIMGSRDSSSSTHMMSFFGTTQKLAYTWNDASNTYNFDSGLTIPNQAWCMVSVSISSSSATLYLHQASGVTSATNNVTHSSATLDNINVGRDSYGSSRDFKGRISVVAFYDRALSSAEIAHNFNVFKVRHGL